MTCHCYSFMDKDINGSHIIGMLALVPFFLEFQLFFYLQSLDLIKLIFFAIVYVLATIWQDINSSPLKVTARPQCLQLKNMLLCFEMFNMPYMCAYVCS